LEKLSQGEKPKAVVMLSGGLDSTLALALTKKLGFEPVALSLKTPFCNFDCGGGACAGDVSDVARKQGVRWVVKELGQEYIEMVRKPKFGRGSGMNPCIDCRVMMFKEGKKLMDDIGADLLVTGEVLGQRPMSQNMRAMEIIERESGLEGRILRPLSASSMKPSVLQRLDPAARSNLLHISGRSRRQQIELAKSLGIQNYPNSGGGCILTEKAYSRRLRDLFEHMKDVDARDIELLKLGRHFRLSPTCKFVVGRNMVENREIELLARDSELLVIARDYVGPTCLLQGGGEPYWDLAASICVRYSDAPKDNPTFVSFMDSGEKLVQERLALALEEAKVKELMI
jgi:tRNA-specific 2-thiouridylase